MAVKSKRLRFEILKRDNFTCRYCGATPLDRPLHVDHVVPESKGGTDDPANLIAACVDCNGGKSAIPLDQRRLKDPETPEQLREYTEQIREYLQLQREVVAAKDEVLETALDRWRESMGDPLKSHVGYIRKAVQDLGLAKALEAIDVTGAKGLHTDLKRIKYFCVVVRNMRDGKDWRPVVESPSPKEPSPALAVVEARWDVALWIFGAYWDMRAGTGEARPPAFNAILRDVLGSTDAKTSKLSYRDVFTVIDQAAACPREGERYFGEDLQRRFVDFAAEAVSNLLTVRDYSTQKGLGRDVYCTTGTRIADDQIDRYVDAALVAWNRAHPHATEDDLIYASIGDVFRQGYEFDLIFRFIEETPTTGSLDDATLSFRLHVAAELIEHDIPEDGDRIRRWPEVVALLGKL